MTDITWALTLQHAGQEKYVTVSGVRGDFAELTRGQMAAFTLSFSSEVSTSFYGEGGYGDSGFDARDTVTRFELARDLQDYAGWADTSSLYDRAAYRERVPSSAVVDSLVVRVEPSPDIAGARGCWGVVTGVDDPSQLAVNGVLELEAHVLAEASEYDSHSAVESAFSSGIS